MTNGQAPAKVVHLYITGCKNLLGLSLNFYELLRRQNTKSVT